MTSDYDAPFKQAISALQAGRLDDAERQFKAVLARQPRNVTALEVLGALLTSRQKFGEAEPHLRFALSLNSSSSATLYNYGIALKGLARPTEALQQLDRATMLKPSMELAWLAKGHVLHELGRYGEALEAYNKALALKPDLVEAHLGRGNVFYQSIRYSEALNAYERALASESKNAEAWLGYGNALTGLERYDDALAAYDKALALLPGLAGAWVGRGNVLIARKRYDEALSAHDKALALNPNLAVAWLGRGNVFYERKLYDQSRNSYQSALRQQPELAEAWNGLGNVLGRLQDHKEAIAAYDKALAVKPYLNGAAGQRLFSKMAICDWSNFDVDCADLITSVRNGYAVTPLFPLLATPSSSSDQLLCAKQWVTNHLPPTAFPMGGTGPRYNHGRIRVAYLSADFRRHAVGQAIVELLERHDRNRFEIIGLSTSADDNSELRRRLKKAFDQFHDIQSKSDVEAARLIRELEIDILVKVAPHTEGSRLGILAHRPAPIQVNGLSAWTSGADFVDYVMADCHALPLEEKSHYTEQIVQLPGSYFPHDSTQNISARNYSRADAGLPEKAFVFCNFGRVYKLNPQMFDVWMRLLKLVDGSTLWLANDHDQATINLRREAQTRGIDPSRLIFAPWMPSLEEYLSRYQLADLFLDTLPYGAHTTSKDALFAGLPVLSCRGQTFVGRVAASQLHAVGLPELVAENLDEYEATALRLARAPEELRALRERLSANRSKHSLFDPLLLCRDFEAAYMEMFQRHKRGEPPKSFTVRLAPSKGLEP